MSTLSKLAAEKGIRYFLVSFSDLRGVQRAKLVPAAAIDRIAAEGAGFAGFAAWLDMTPADPDVLAMADAKSLIQLPWKPEVAWIAGDLLMNGKPVEQSPRRVLARQIQSATELGYAVRTGVECEFFVLSPDGAAIGDEENAASRNPRHNAQTRGPHAGPFIRKRKRVKVVSSVAGSGSCILFLIAN